MKSLPIVILSAAIGVILSGCSSTSQSSTGDPELDKSLQSSEARFFSKAGGQGCILGGLGAGGVCLLASPNSHVMCVMAAVGGCLVGMGTNYLLDKIRADYATTEQRLDALRDFMDKDLKAGRQLVRTLKKLLSEDRAELARLERSLTDKSIIADTKAEQCERMDRNIEYMQAMLEEARERLNQVKVARNSLALRSGLSRDAMLKVADIDYAYKAQKELFNELEQAIADYNKARYLL